jgi:outer membrane immunogenic protein
MKLLSGILGLTLTSVVALASANAADIYRAPEAVGGYKDSYVPVTTWTGFYVGVNGGYGWQNNSTTPILRDALGGTDKLSHVDASGGFGGGQIGYNWQHGPLVYGIEADLQGAGIEDSASGIGTGSATFRYKSNLDWFGTVRGRLGYAFGPALVYATGGFAYGGIKDVATTTIPNSSAKFDDTATGFVVGGGVEYPGAPKWTLKVEYQYIDLGSDKLAGSFPAATPANPVSSNEIDHNYHTIRAGLNYRVGQTYEPLK